MSKASTYPIGSNIATFRKMRGWSQQDFADLVGVNRSLVGAWEENRSLPGYAALFKICDLFAFKGRERDFVTTRYQIKVSHDYSVTVCEQEK